MSLYRQPTGRPARTIALVTLAALLVGGGVGFAIGRSTAPERSLAELAADVRQQVRPAQSALELVTIEYPQSVEDGKIVAETEYAAARAQAQTAADTVAGARADLVALNPSAVEDASEAITEVGRLMSRHADPAVVERAAGRANAAVERLARAGAATSTGD
jgi:hypothetical protein